MAELLKDLYSKEFIEKLTDKFLNVYPKFEKEKFINTIFDSSWANLELKARMRYIAITLDKFLPFSYKEQIDILKEVKKDFFGLEAMIFQDFVEIFGLDDFETSIKALEAFTIKSSSEFAIRQFILKYEDETMTQMKLWAKSQDEDIRRLSSEGCRPRLPWAIALPKFKKNPKKVFEIIELLKNDSSKYVQKSVANNLNDISKDNPSLVIEFLQKNLGISKDLDWICKHGSRTMLKNGNKEVLKLFGFDKVKNIEISNLYCEESVKIGDYLNFSFELISKEKLENVRVEYIIDYLKQNNKYSKKIFMISQINFSDKSKKFIKKHSFKDMTTRKHIKGIHSLSIVINGEKLIEKSFLVN
ncbi:DNA alkylation repair protein [Aliarcobacter vitoriensis]|uniref:DNA alkylation repair protein n=1 Tax=Aliarcobacter vitoriensis TaxID=2011099 RepID=A0A366MU33_9BACT|nr:DNA alkylation repair protein [Aliarcobacter vitoriensis]RBQ28999.1 DNA alkylation repair protein [Aliarcobacter vitoriensis]